MELSSENASGNAEDNTEQTVLQNITKWQALEGALAPLTKDQMDALYQIEDFIQEKFYSNQKDEQEKEKENTKKEELGLKIDTQEDYIKWMVSLEDELNSSEVNDYKMLCEGLEHHSLESTKLFEDSEAINETFQDLLDKYKKVTYKTDFLHYLHEEIMESKKQLEEKQSEIQERLKYFKRFHALENSLMTPAQTVNNKKYVQMLKEIDESIEFLDKNNRYKETYYYKANFVTLLTKHLLLVYKHFTNSIESVVAEMKHHDAANLLELKEENSETNAFSFYYGKFQNASTKLNNILPYLEEKSSTNELYKKILSDCEKSYFTERSSIIIAAVGKSLTDLKTKHVNEQSTLFRLSLLFIAKVVQDEIACYHYFFSLKSQLLNAYLAGLCQTLYDVLRSSLIAVKHLEVLTELCTIIKEILLNLTQNDEEFEPLLETIKQLLSDVQERIVYRSNVYFQHDIASYIPSTGDLAYPEKLEQLESIYKDDPNSSLTDLHSMWYPTVKRCLVCISRLYICLDRQTFQSLAQEALMVCAKSLEDAANKISSSKTKLHGKLFQIKHLLIIREQIAPFQADFTVKEMSIDIIANLKSAAVDLIHNSDKMFSLNNNAFLEFLLKGTPKLKEYFVDSRKEIDKQLKLSCEDFISHSTSSMVGNLQAWLKEYEGQKFDNVNNKLKNTEHGKPTYIGELIVTAQKNIKSYIPHLQKYMKLYLANRDTEFILFRPVKNNIINVFIEVQQFLVSASFSQEDLAIVACPTSEQLNVLIYSVSLTSEEELTRSRSRHSSVASH